MDNGTIQFHLVDVNFNEPFYEVSIPWIKDVVEEEGGSILFLNYIFCTDAYLLEINQSYLNHDTFTDIVTFPYNKFPTLEADLFISIDRVKENASTFNTSFKSELFRVMIHGVLHLCNYSDKSVDQQKLMREKEDQALKKLKKMEFF